MPLSPRQKRALRRELRDLLFQVAIAAGAMLGLLWAMNRPEPAPPASCAQNAADRVAGCANETFLASLLPYLDGVAGGAVAGAVVAAVVAPLVLPRRARGAHRSPLGRWSTARQAGQCRRCPADIAPGDRILHVPGEALCATCGADSRP